MSSRIKNLTGLGQSLWYDYMERRILENGEFAQLVEQGDVRGLTSNPSIFNNAIAKTKDYDSALIPMSWAGYSDKKILEQLMVEDIERVADILRPLFDQTHGGDGFVSLEVRPDLAYETEKTIAEAQRLWGIVQRPNVMIKIPATQPGIAAIRKSIASGINVNITLIFSTERYKEVMDAYLAGLEDRLSSGEPIDHIHSVASFFVSRIDTKVDKYLEPIIKGANRDAQIAKSLLGKIAITNARLAYEEFRKVFEGERFKKLLAKGANLQRPLWASTSTKNPAYSDTMYVDELIGQHTVNTVPPQTLQAFKEHGTAQLTIEKDLEGAHKALADLEGLGISMKKVTQELEQEGVEAFSESYTSLDNTIKMRRENHASDLGSLAQPVATRINRLQNENFLERFYSKDATLWTSDPKGEEEVRIRMGWLTSPDKGSALAPELMKFASEIKKAGFTRAVLLGMGGSSLAAEVMSLIFSDEISGLKLTILDSTDPDQVLRTTQRNPVSTTLYIVSSKSGSTAEVEAMLSYFWKRAEKVLGEKAADHFIAITDPGTTLERLAFERKFRKIFLADAQVGGRYSALTAFGLVPAALMGIDIAQLINCASWKALECKPGQPYGRNPGLVWGAIIGEATLQGKDKLTIIADPEVAAFGTWLEQLVAESSGKQGKGILPVNGEAPGDPEKYGNDRIFVYLRRSGKYDAQIEQIRAAGYPVLKQNFMDNYALGAEFFKWEFAVATACSIIGVNAFNQPDVQDSKNRTIAKITYYKEHHGFKESSPMVIQRGISIYGDISLDGKQIPNVVSEFLKSAKPDDYVAINAYLMRDQKNTAALQQLRTWIRDDTHLATMLGFGPRFQHSTGQLHKGGENNGLFLVITTDHKKDVDIPEEGLSFGTMEYGQALGDMEALQARGRRVLRIHLTNPDLLPTLVNQIAK